METKEQDKRWHLVRNDNGEWISEEHVVYVSALEATLLKVQAVKQGKTLSVHHGSDALLWCYRHEWEAIDYLDKEKKTYNRKLKIKKL